MLPKCLLMTYSNAYLSLNNCVSDSQTLEVVLVEESIVVNVVHVAHDELDSVVPTVRHDRA